MDSDPSVLSKKQQATFQLLQPSIGPRLIPYLGRQERVGKTVDELQILQEEGLTIEEVHRCEHVRRDLRSHTALRQSN